MAGSLRTSNMASACAATCGSRMTSRAATLRIGWIVVPLAKPASLAGARVRVQRETISAHLAAESIAHRTGKRAALQRRVDRLAFGGRKLLGIHAGEDTPVHLFGR